MARHLNKVEFLHTRMLCAMFFLNKWSSGSEEDFFFTFFSEKVPFFTIISPSRRERLPKTHLYVYLLCT